MFSLFRRRRKRQIRVDQQARRRRDALGGRRRDFERLEDRTMLATFCWLQYEGVPGESAEAPPARIEMEVLPTGASNPTFGSDSSGASQDVLLDFIQAPSGNEPAGYMAYKLEHVFVSSYQSGGSEDLAIPTES